MFCIEIKTSIFFFNTGLADLLTGSQRQKYKFSASKNILRIVDYSATCRQLVGTFKEALYTFSINVNVLNSKMY